MEVGSSCADGESGFSQGRWPREETLTLLEIRTRLHLKFQQASAQKSPLWDEVSRIMAEEHGYQRSGKTCKQKLDNLYKYYKKTKVSSAKGGNHNGKHYRFFKQLQALYGLETNTSTNASFANEMLVVNQEAIRAHNQSITTNSDEFDNSTSSEEEEVDGDEEEEEDGFGIRLKIQDLIETQVRRLMDAQESWMENILEAIKRMEQERASRDEAWQRQELLRSEQEKRFWACERAWIEARDAALINALERTGCRCRHNEDNWSEMKESEPQQVAADDNDEIADLIRLQNWVQPEHEYDRYINGLLC